MKYLLIILILFFGLTICYAEDKGWKMAYNIQTGELLEKAYGDSGMTHRENVIVIPSKDCNDGQIKLEEYIYKHGRIEKRPQAEITARETAKKDKEKRAKIIDLTMKKDIAKKLGYTDEEAEYQKEIDKLNE